MRSLYNHESNNFKAYKKKLKKKKKQFKNKRECAHVEVTKRSTPGVNELLKLYSFYYYDFYK